MREDALSALKLYFPKNIQELDEERDITNTRRYASLMGPVKIAKVIKDAEELGIWTILPVAYYLALCCDSEVTYC